MAVTPNSAVLAQAVRRTAAVATAAKTTYNDSANAVQLASGGTNGSIVRALRAIPRATVSATQLQLYASDGTNYFLVSTALMGAYTMSQTTQVPATDFGFTDATPLYLPSGWSLWVGIGVALAGGIVFGAELGDF